MNTTIRKEIDKEIQKHEKEIAALKRHRAGIFLHYPKLLDIKVPHCHVHVYGRWVRFNICDTKREMPQLPFKLAELSDTPKVMKKLTQDVEQMRFAFGTLVDVYLRRAPRQPTRCRKAVVKQTIEFCGELPSGAEVIEWLEE